MQLYKYKNEDSMHSQEFVYGYLLMMKVDNFNPEIKVFARIAYAKLPHENKIGKKDHGQFNLYVPLNSWEYIHNRQLEPITDQEHKHIVTVLEQNIQEFESQVAPYKELLRQIR